MHQVHEQSAELSNTMAKMLKREQLIHRARRNYQPAPAKKPRGERTMYVLYNPDTMFELLCTDDLDRLNRIASVCSENLLIRTYIEDPEETEAYNARQREEKRFQLTGPTRPAVSPQVTEGTRAGGIMIFHPRQAECSTISSVSRYA